MRRKKILVIGIVVFSILLTVFGLYAYQSIYTPNILVEKENQYLYVYPNTTYQSLLDSLYTKDIVQDNVSFGVVARLMKLDKSIKPGRYLLKSNMNNRQAVTLLRAGKQDPVNITFNNARTTADMAYKLTQNLMIDGEELLEVINDKDVAEQYPFDEESLRVMFIPNTYEVYWTITAEELLDRMYYEYKQFWTDERKAKADSLRMSPVEVTILASIVEAETKKREESPTIAGLYLNRLKRGMLLQADPTLIYAAGDFSIKRVLNRHKEIDSPYNTYMYAGLPPGPINFPTIHSIDAVLNYKDHNYLYMCAKEDFSGYHYFTASLNQHLNNARKFQRALNKARLYR
jgi:UPF0755 protein